MTDPVYLQGAVISHQHHFKQVCVEDVLEYVVGELVWTIQEPSQ